MRNISHPAKRQQGLSLIETLAGLAIFGLIVTYGVYRYVTANQRNSVNQLTAHASTIYTSMQAAKGSPGYGLSDYNFALSLAKAFDPKTYNVVVASNVATITNASTGGSVTTLGAGNNFTYQETLVDAGRCASWLPNISESQYSSVTVGATTLTTPINGAQAAAACGTTSSTVLLTSRG